MIEKLFLQTLLSLDQQQAAPGVQDLDVAEIGAKQFDRSSKHFVKAFAQTVHVPETGTQLVQFGQGFSVGVNAGFGGFALSDIDEHVDAADEFARVIEKRRGMGHEPNPSAVRTLGDGFGAAYSASFPERDRHWTLIVRHRPAVGMK